MKKNKRKIIQRISQKKAEKNRKRKQNKLETKNRLTSLREIHIDKSDDEKKEYLFHLDNEYSPSNDKEELQERVKEKRFKEPKIKSAILSTDFEIQDFKQTEEVYQRDKISGNDKIKSWLFRIKSYWIRNYPELIVKELLVKAIGVVFFGLITFFLGLYLQGSVSDKKIEELRKEFLDIKKNNTTIIKQTFDDLYNEKIEEINFNVDKKIDDRLDILKAIQNIDDVKLSD